VPGRWGRDRLPQFDHVERLGHLETHGLDDGTCHVFAKLDGSNGSVWLDSEGQVQCGSRNQHLSDSRDNHGFRAYVLGDDPRAASLRAALTPGFVYYGEWLVRHTIQCYQPDAWRRFWVFDVLEVATGRYVHWDDYGPALMSLGVDVLEPVAVIDRPTSAHLSDLMHGDRTLLLAGVAAIAQDQGMDLMRDDARQTVGRDRGAEPADDGRHRGRRGRRCCFAGCVVRVCKSTLYHARRPSCEHRGERPPTTNRRRPGAHGPGSPRSGPPG
jgi:hypothetical protein